MAGTRQFALLLLPLLARLFTVTHGQNQPIRINCGSTKTEKDSLGREWKSDRYYIKGDSRTWTEKKSKNIGGTKDDFLYKSERYGSKTLKYVIPVPNGDYNVRLLFSENYHGKRGERVFDVKIEKEIPFRSVDIFFKAGGKNRKWDAPVHRTTVKDGRLTIEFIPKTGDPKVGAIEIIPATGRSNRNPHPDISYIANVKHKPPMMKPMGLPWADSYSRDGRCYCDGMTTFDHEIENFRVNTPVGWKTVKEICKLLGRGPGRRSTDPIYNDVQCGNGPPNNAADEHTCPGRVDIGFAGCGHIGPKWNFDELPTHPERQRFFLDVGGSSDSKYLVPRGKTWEYDARRASGNKRVTIKKNEGIPARVYETHRSGKSLEFKIGGFVAAEPYQVSLGFAEVWPDNCMAGKRVMSIKINGNPYENMLDIWKEAGCGGALVEKFVLTANVKGQFEIFIGASVENAMLSSIDIVPLRVN